MRPSRGPHTRWSHRLRVQKRCWDVMPGLLRSRPGHSANSLAPGPSDQPAPLLPGNTSFTLGPLVWKAEEGPQDSDVGPWSTKVSSARSTPRAGSRGQHLPPGPHSLVSVGSFPQLVGSDPPGEVEKAHGVLEVEVRDCCVLDERAEPQNQRGQARGPRTPEPRPLRTPRTPRAREVKGLVCMSEARMGPRGCRLGLFPRPSPCWGLAPSPPKDTESLPRASDTSRHPAVPGPAAARCPAELAARADGHPPCLCFSC